MLGTSFDVCSVFQKAFSYFGREVDGARSVDQISCYVGFYPLDYSGWAKFRIRTEKTIKYSSINTALSTVQNEDVPPSIPFLLFEDAAY